MGRLITAATAAFLAIGGLLFGYDSGMISSTIVQPHFVAYMGRPSDRVTGGIVSGFTGGAILGSLAISYIADRLGRKRTVFIGAVISTTGCTIQAASINIAMLITGRFISGFAVGILSAIVPMYCSEIATSQDRGKLAGLLQFMFSCGFFVAQWLGYGCYKVNSNFQWRFPLAFQIIPGTIMATGIWFLTESPRWLIEKQRFEEARLVLERLHSTGSNADFLDVEFRAIRDKIVTEKTTSVKSWKDLVSRPSWRRRLMLGCGVQAFTQLSGVNVINYYGPRMYLLLGVDAGTALWITGISRSLLIICCAIGLYSLDKIGRVRPLVFSAGGCALTLLVNSILGQYHVLPGSAIPANVNVLRTMVSMNFLFSLVFTMTGIVSWVYPAEIYPSEIRVRANSISTFTNWSLNIVFAQISPIVLGKIGFKYFYIFFIFNVIAAVCYALFYPETKGKTLEQMDQLFSDPVPLHELREIAKIEAVKAVEYHLRTRPVFFV